MSLQKNILNSKLFFFSDGLANKIIHQNLECDAIISNDLQLFVQHIASAAISFILLLVSQTFQLYKHLINIHPINAVVLCLLLSGSVEHMVQNVQSCDLATFEAVLPYLFIITSDTECPPPFLKGVGEAGHKQPPYPIACQCKFFVLTLAK